MDLLKISRKYFETFAQPRLKLSFPALYRRLAVGLVGNGSECFGFDDMNSRDHDWGVDFFIWTRDEDKDMTQILSEWKSQLFKEEPPEFVRSNSEYGARIGIMTSGEFYAGLTGTPQGPKTIYEWVHAPEENLAMAVNGSVFYDGFGEFTKTRNYILEYYPEDLRLKKIAAKCMILAQTGQYNHGRTARRGDKVTLRIVLSRFTEAAMSLAFLLKKNYKPYYKWSYRSLCGLPDPGAQIADILLKLAEAGGLDSNSFYLRQKLITELCEIFTNELKAQGLSSSNDWFLTTHAQEVQNKIQDNALRALPTQYDI